ncbi:MAG: LysM peptidoglycan-binding protein [Acidobacteriota bacterium]|nr:LysM peptidoglycan-binding protein [Acidobacteriota bacterium]
MVRNQGCVGFLSLALALALPAAQAAAAEVPTERPADKVEVGPSATPVTSVALGSLPVVLQPHPYVDKAKDRQNPLAHEPDQGRRGTWDRSAVPPDPLAARSLNPTHLTPAPLFTFAGIGNPLACGGCSPPDTVGDVGPTHYMQMVNATKLAAFNKVGTLVGGPIDLSSLWSSGDCAADAGDPVVSYDPLADRWVLAQFNGADTLCFAVSQTANPLGTYWIYDFQTTDFPDYFKIGVWPDGYYVSTNEANYNAWAFDRVKMLQGLVAGSIKATGFAANFLMPADVDGIVAPPPGAPAIYYTFLDNSFHGGTDRLELRAFDVNWVTPALSTFTTIGSPAVTSFTYTVCGFFNLSCAPQPGTGQQVDVVSEWPMFRLAYRRFPGHEALVGNFTVPVSGRAAPRWFELRGSGTTWTLFQQGTYDPDATTFRFMGSIAQDREGSIALGYSATSAAVSPAIRFATRLAGDPAGTLGSESTLIAGGGSQTGSDRWGDYSALSIDPADECTFWYTNQYYTASSGSNWATRIGAFRVPQCKGIFFDNFETGGRTRWSSAVP